MYLVIETCDRELSDINPAKDRKEATELANGLLADHLETIGYPRDEPDLDSQLRRADPENGESGAWSNLKNARYDAFVAALGSDGAGRALEILLEELCKGRTAQEDSGCYDGACENCPVSAVLHMARAAQK